MPVRSGASCIGVHKNSCIGVHKNTNMFSPKPCKPKGTQPSPTLLLPPRDFASSGSGAVDMTVGWYDFFQNFLDDV